MQEKLGGGEGECIYDKVKANWKGDSIFVYATLIKFLSWILRKKFLHRSSPYLLLKWSPQVKKKARYNSLVAS